MENDRLLPLKVDPFTFTEGGGGTKKKMLIHSPSDQCQQQMLRPVMFCMLSPRVGCFRIDLSHFSQRPVENVHSDCFGSYSSAMYKQACIIPTNPCSKYVRSERDAVYL